MISIPLIDLKAQYGSIEAECRAAFDEVLESAHFVGGPAVAAFEQRFASYCQAQHAVAVANGTDALSLTLRAAGVGPGDEVITVPFTFTATAESIHWTGAKIVFADISAQTYTLDADLLEPLITEKTKALLPVHLYGHPADMDAILQVARKYDLKVIEDASQAHGARYKNRRVGSLGHAAIFSFYPSKNLGAYGDAGAVTTNDPGIAENVKMLRDHGNREGSEPEALGFNSRLDALQAAALNVKLKYLDQWNQRRREIADFYNQALAEHASVVTPKSAAWAEPVYHLYTLQAENRDQLQQELQRAGIGTGVYYRQPLHLLKTYQFLGYARGRFPVAEKLAQKVLSLPVYPEMTDTMAERVVEKVKELISM